MIQKIKNWLKNRNKELTPLINKFALIERTQVAKFKGIDDDFNKVIVVYEKGIAIKKYPYSEAVVNSIKQVDEIPVIDEDNFIDEDDFEWDEPTEFGVVKEIKYG